MRTKSVYPLRGCLEKITVFVVSSAWILPAGYDGVIAGYSVVGLILFLSGYSGHHLHPYLFQSKVTVCNSDSYYTIFSY
jgi:hypothetical protein